MNVIDRLNNILQRQGWTKYRLAKESNVPESTITNIFHRNTVPTIDTLEKICQTLNISLADFFADDERVEFTTDLKELYEHWLPLSPEKKSHIIQTMKFMK